MFSFDGETLRYTPPDKLGWELHKSKIAAVAETTYAGTDYGMTPAYCFLERKGTYFLVPYNAPGCQFAMTALSLAMRTNLSFTFQKTRGLESRIIWPRTLRGQPMFIYTRLPAKGLLGRVFRAPDVEQKITLAVLKMLAEQRIGAKAPLPQAQLSAQPTKVG